MSSKVRHPSFVLIGLIGAQALALGAFAQTADETGDTARRSTSAASTGMKAITPESFASQAAVLNKAEIELSQLALKNTKNEETRLFAERMIKDHTAASEKLEKIAQEQNISLPQSLDAEHQATKQKLATLEGEAFNREYRKEMAKGHDKAVALFQSASQDKQMPEELREFAASTLRTLEDHQEDAHDMNEEVREGA